MARRVASPTPDVVLAAPPADWRPAPGIAPPKVTSAATLTSFEALAAPTGDAFLVRGCVAAKIPGWVEDMRPSIEARGVALLGAATERATALPTDARPRPGSPGVFELRPAAHLDAPPTGTGRSILGFGEQSEVLTCFASCVSLAGPPREACESAVVGAHLSADLPPPPPGILLGATTWAVHHPRPFAGGAAALLVASVALALALRPRPRSRIFRGK